MNSENVISKTLRPEPGLELEGLKQEALSLIQRYATQTWTDHNTHDPGITILEILCVVIRDLSYRLTFPLPDLLQRSSKEDDEHYFWERDDILPNAPTTSEDWQDIFCEIPHVREARTELAPGIHGAYGAMNAVVDLVNNVNEPMQDEKQLVDLIRKKMISQRNVGEDIQTVVIKPVQRVAMVIALSLERNANPETVLCDLMLTLNEIISPNFIHQSPNFPREKKVDSSLIFDKLFSDKEGVGTNQFHLNASKHTLFSSDVIAEILKVEKICDLWKLQFISDDSPAVEDSDLQWMLSVEPHKTLTLDIDQTLSEISIVIDGHLVELETQMKVRIMDTVKARSSQLLSRSQKNLSKDNYIEDGSNEQLTGRYRQLNRYKTLQKEFPQNYKLGNSKIPSDESLEVRAQVRQLQGFLLLFDQILANQFQQLEQIKYLLSLPGDRISSCVYQPLQLFFTKLLSSEAIGDRDISLFWKTVQQLPITHSSQPIQDLSAVQVLLGEYFCHYQSPEFNQMTEQNFSHKHLDRLSRSLQHLLARYHETNLDANVLNYPEVIQLYLSELHSHRHAPKGMNKTTMLQNLVSLKQILDMADTLREYPLLSRRRGGGHNYLGAQGTMGLCHQGETEALILQRIYRQLGLLQAGQRSLAVSNEEGIHLIEEVLLRHKQPIKPPEDLAEEGDGAESEGNIHRVLEAQAYTPDIQGNQLYFILPSWPTRFNHPAFNGVLREVIFRETPVHLWPVIIFLERYPLSLFERIYNAWVNAMTQLPVNVIYSTGEASFESLSQSEKTQYERIQHLSEIIAGCCQTPDKIFELSLNNIELNLIESTLLQWQEDKIINLGSEFLTNLFHSRLSKDDILKQLIEVLPEERIYALCQNHFEIMTQPYPISHDQAHIALRFRIGYCDIDILKPVNPVGQTRIHPSQPKSQPFTIAVSSPNVIPSSALHYNTNSIKDTQNGSTNELDE